MEACGRVRRGRGHSHLSPLKQLLSLTLKRGDRRTASQKLAHSARIFATQESSLPRSPVTRRFMLV